MKHIPALDGLRAVAILTVLASHVVTSLIPGGFGVTLFFFISGFIITRLLLLTPKFGRQELMDFYLRRFFRLAPALFVFLFASGLVMRMLGDVIPTKDFAATLLYYANYHVYTMFTPVTSPLAVTWSLAVEEHFYMVFPLVVFLFRRNLTPILLACVVSVLAWRCFLVYDLHASQVRTYTGTDTRLDSIAWGCLLSVLMHADETALLWAGTRKAQVAGAAALAVSFIARNDAFRETLRYSLQGFAFFVGFYGLFRASAGPSWVRRFLESSPMQFVGRISYSIYLYHFLALSVATALIPAGPIRMFFALATGLAGAYVSYLWIERPMRAWGSRITHRSVREPEMLPLVAPELSP